MMGTKNPTLIVTPRFYKDNAAFEKMIFADKAVNLQQISERNVIIDERNRNPSLLTPNRKKIQNLLLVSLPES